MSAPASHLPPATLATVQRILDREARRLLAEKAQAQKRDEDAEAVNRA
jgi:hypothetical protein